MIWFLASATFITGVIIGWCVGLITRMERKSQQQRPDHHHGGTTIEEREALEVDGEVKR